MDPEMQFVAHHGRESSEHIDVDMRCEATLDAEDLGVRGPSRSTDGTRAQADREASGP
jgi:hypothetical protein